MCVCVWGGGEGGTKTSPCLDEIIKNHTFVSTHFQIFGLKCVPGKLSTRSCLFVLRFYGPVNS